MRVTFSNWQPGKRDYLGAREAEKAFTKSTGIKISPQTQRHHINWDRSDGRKENIAIAKNQKQHDSWHRQMIKYVVDSVNSGLLKFSFKDREYYSDDPYIVEKVETSRLKELHAA